jgi:zinc transport system substrate-binding protein
MKRSSFIVLFYCLFLLLFSLLYFWSSVADAKVRPTVYVVNYPLMYFAQRIAGDHAQVVLPVPEDVDPAFWKPDAAAVERFQHADLILLNGAGYAKWVSRASLPRRKLVDTSAAFHDRYIATEGGATHSHGREGEHSHAGTAFTTWLDFTQAAEQAKSIRDALSRLTPEHKDEFAANYRALESDLLDLDARLSAISSRRPAPPIIASHPVYQYMARRYALDLKSVMWEPDAMPNDAEWKNFVELHQRYPADLMLWEAAPAPDIAERLRKLGVQSTVFNPCGNRPENGDFMSIMNANIEYLQRNFAH